MNNFRPKKAPLVGRWIIKRFAHCEDSLSLTGDLEELYALKSDSVGRLRAWVWYWNQVLISIPPSIRYTIRRNGIMFKNYIKIALRNLIKQKTFSTINILGLSLGMTCSILILLYVQYELSYDKFHDKAERLYRVVDDRISQGNLAEYALTSAPMAASLREAFPEVNGTSRILAFGNSNLDYAETHLEAKKIIFADQAFFDLFTYKSILGDISTALNDQSGLVISASLAEALFGKENPLGKVVSGSNIMGFGFGQEFQVTGVIEDPPKNSHFRFDAVGMLNVPGLFGPTGDQNWIRHMFYTYIELDERANYKELEAKLPEFMVEYAGAQAEEKGFVYIPHLQPITSIHLGSDRQFELDTNGNITYIYMFLVVAFLILLIACFNFMNLSTARSVIRAREVGMRKVVGARRNQLVHQFLGESFLAAFLATTIAVIAVSSLLPFFNSFVGRDLQINYLENLGYMLGLVLAVGLIAGSYPAFFLSAFRPISVLKDEVKSTFKNAVLRQGLVVLQFAISIGLIFGTGVVNSQLNYFKNKNLGFDRERIVYTPLRGDMRQNLQNIKQEFLQNPNIARVSAAWGIPGGNVSGDDIVVEETGVNWSMRMLSVDFDFISTMGMEVIAGRDFSRELSSDTLNAFVINEAAVTNFGWTVEEAIGKRLNWNEGEKIGSVIGVVKDFHFSTLKEKIEPITLHIVPRYMNLLIYRLQGENISETIDFIQAKYQLYAPNETFKYTFLDDTFNSKYRAEEKMSEIFNYFSVLAIFIACLGLFGLASFTAEQKTKEIGIRKVLGATVSGLVVRITHEFVKLVVVASIVAIPATYYLMNNWLQNFPYKTSIGVGAILVAVTLGIFIAVITVVYQALKAAYTNPVQSLKYE